MLNSEIPWVPQIRFQRSHIMKLCGCSANGLDRNPYAGNIPSILPSSDSLPSPAEAAFAGSPGSRRSIWPRAPVLVTAS